MKEENNEFMKRAIELAKENANSTNGGPFGAVVVKDGKIIGEGFNSVTTNNDPTAHAEINAIRDACKNLKSYQLDECEIYASSEPCPMCLGAIYWARVKKIYYACSLEEAKNHNFDDVFIYDEFEKPREKRLIPSEQIMQKEGLEIFKKWKNNDKKIEY
ncbi:MAG: nucleoside deaminase [Bacteroidales bacterium]|nr:nucleoside deaminase [Bacteroidales bacterium]